VAARVAARIGAGLTGDAVELERAGDRLLCWKPAFGGQLLAAVTASSPVQLATVRPGVRPLPEPRAGRAAIRLSTVEVEERCRVRVTEAVHDDDPDALALARAVVGVGQGIDPADYPDLKPLLELLDAELGATRKVTDLGWLPRSRQIGITGQSIAPAVYVALAVHGKLTHLAGVRRAGFVLAVNADPDAPIFDGADFGIVGDWREAVPLLVRELS
jgi:electron transfer flavoprotein alpha subunit